MGGSVADAGGAVDLHPAQAVNLVVDIRLGALGDLGHGAQGLHGVGAGSGLARQHDGRGAVIDGVGHVRDLGAGGAGVADHAVQHLGGGDNGLAVGEGPVDDGLLDAGQLREIDFNAQVAAGHHDGVGGSQDAVDVLDALGVLDLGDDPDLGVIHVQQVADLIDILCGAHKGSGDQVKALLDAEDDVVPVPLAHIGHGQVDAGNVDALLVLDLAAVQDGAGDIGIGDFPDGQLDQAVVQHDGAAGGHIVGQILIGDADDFLGAFHIAGGEGEGLAFLQHLGTILEVLQTDLGAFGVQHGGHRLVQLFPDGLQGLQTALVLFMGAMGKIEAGHVHPVFHERPQHAFLVGGRSEGADDLGLAHVRFTSWHTECQFE